MVKMLPMNHLVENTPAPKGAAASDGPLIMELKKLYRSGKYGQVFMKAHQGVMTHPDNKRLKMWLGFALKEMTVNAYRDDIKESLTACLQTPDLEHQNFYGGWIRTLLMDPKHQYLQNLRKCKTQEDFNKAFNIETFKNNGSDDPFLIEGLRNLIIPEQGLEIAFTRIRKKLLENRQNIPAELTPFLSGLAQICFFNEYAYFETEEETKSLPALEESIKAGEADLPQLCLYAAYLPLWHLDNAEEILKRHGALPDLQRLLHVQIAEPLKQQSFRKHIPDLCEIEDNVSSKVQEMYEENPYPRWKMVNLPLHTIDTKGEWLVAGCGTCKPTVQQASIFPDIQFTAVDLSLTSLSYGMLKAEEIGLKNITFGRCDILKLDALDKQFDVIECTGVLHHMEDPVAGWRQLIKRLKPGGLMQIALYSTLARQDIIAGRNYITEKGYEANKQGIRQYRQDVYAMASDHPVKPTEQRRDFHYMSGCRDLVFHIQESTYTLPELSDILDELGLTITHFCLHSTKFKSLYQKTFPQDPTITNLENWHRLEQEHPYIFSGMYGFLCCRKEDAENLNPTAKSIQETIYTSLLGKQ